MPTNGSQNMTDQLILQDLLTSQKAITGSYNTFTNECANQNLRDDFLNILHEEHNLQATVFKEMEKRGWYNPEAAEQQKIDQTKTKFENISQTL